MASRICWLLILLSPCAAWAAETPSTAGAATPTLASPDTNPCRALKAQDRSALKHYEQQGLPIGEVFVDVAPVFDENDPDQDNWLYRQINALHTPPKEKVVRQDLLFRPGESFSLHVLEESERLLRGRRYLREPRIEAVGPCTDKVDLRVTVQGVWTLLPDISLSRKGGENSSRLGFRDTNFLGRGHEVIVVQESDEERHGISFNYRDPSFGSQRAVLDFEYADNSDGSAHAFSIFRPFFALDTPWSAGVANQHRDAEFIRYVRGEETERFRRKTEQDVLFGGWSNGLHAGVSHRFLLGLQKDRAEFSALPRQTTQPQHAATLPNHRDIQQLWSAWERVEDRFVKVENVNQIFRTEDLNLGWQLQAKLGRASTLLNSAFIGWIYELQASRNWLLGERQVLEAQTWLRGFHNDQQHENQWRQLDLRWHRGDFQHQQTYVSLSLAEGTRLYGDQIMEAGGEQGLRGYPLHYQSGDRRALLSVEKRWYFEREWFSLFHLGAVAFFDMGRAWRRENAAENDWLRNVGVGLRISPTRTGNNSSGGGTVIHLDLAHPLDDKDNPALGNWEWTVTVKNRF